MENSSTTPSPGWQPPEPFDLLYRELCARVMDGPEVEVRGLKTHELIAMNFTIDPMRPLSGRLGFSVRFALTETLQVIHGRGDVRQLAELAPQFPSMAPSYVTYGPRAAWQLQAVHDKLRGDLESRQAIVQIYQPEDLHKGYPDCPCTMSLQFLVRSDSEGELRLHLIATMRSNDIWFGTPTDVFMFTFLQRQMAASLRLKTGSYHHQAGSFHVYEQHYDKVRMMLGTPPLGNPQPEIQPYPNYDWTKVRLKAGEWLDGKIDATKWTREIL